MRKFSLSSGGKISHSETGCFFKTTKTRALRSYSKTFVKQDFIDRLLGMASISIENASEGAGGTSKYSKTERYEIIGFRGNKVVIPGLKKADADSLKNIFLERMKANLIDDSQSGL